MTKFQDLPELFVMLFEEMKRSKRLDQVSARTARAQEHKGHQGHQGHQSLTSASAVLRAAFANSTAARSCSSLAATGFDRRVSSTAFRA
jgi:hypothetical protein